MSEKLEDVNGHQMAGLVMDLLFKLRKGVISIWEFKSFLMMRTEERKKTFGIEIKEHGKIKQISSESIVDGSNGFNPIESLVESKKVKYLFCASFKEYVLNGAENFDKPIPEISISKYRFIEKVSDDEIMGYFKISESCGLMGKEEILWYIFTLTNKQPKGETGILMNNGHATVIGYLQCHDGIIRNVCVRWNSGNKKWNCYCNELDYWDAGREMIDISVVEEVLVEN